MTEQLPTNSGDPDPTDLAAFSRDLSLRLVSRILKRARTNAGIKQTELAATTGLSQPAVSAIEVGSYLPSIEVARSLAEAVNLPVIDLLDPIAVAPFLAALDAPTPALQARIEAVTEAYDDYTALVVAGLDHTNAVDQIAASLETTEAAA